VTYLLDANACIDHLRKGSSSKVSAKLINVPAGSVAMCSVVLGELLFGAKLSQRPTIAISKVLTFCQPYVSLPFDDNAANEYSDIRLHLSRTGKPIGPNDMMIAAIAIVNGLILVTHIVADFSRIPRLKFEDWQ
jgi:tRNA(fMet)-specific endonuclease VapC